MNSDALDERLQVEFVRKLWCALFREPAMLHCDWLLILWLLGDALGDMRQARVKIDEEILEGKVRRSIYIFPCSMPATVTYS